MIEELNVDNVIAEPVVGVLLTSFARRGYEAFATPEGIVFASKVARSSTEGKGYPLPASRAAIESRADFRNRPAIEIYGESFYIEPEDGLVFLRHPSWSLLGVGSTLVEAERNLIKEARELAEVFLDLPVHRLGRDALDLRDFLLNAI